MSKFTHDLNSKILKFPVAAPENPRKQAYLWGKSCEDEARLWFEQQNPDAKFISQNLHSYRGEIDLIFELHQERTLIFIEVKARTRELKFCGAIESMSYTKRRRLKRAIDQFLLSYQGRAQYIRIDVLALEAGTWTHWKNLWILED